MSPMVRRELAIELALLGFLQQGPLHGYQLHQQLCRPQGLKQIWTLKQAQLYALLNKLEEAGYIEGALQPQETRPARRVFHVTESGREVFLNWALSPVARPRQMRQEFQAKLYFACQLGSEACTRLVEAQRLVCRQWQAEQEACLETEPAGAVYVQLVERYRVGQIQAMLDWLDLCQERLA